MDEFIIFKFRPDIREKIKNSKANTLKSFQEYDLTRKEIALVWAIENNIKSYKRLEPIYNFGSDELYQNARKQYIIDYNNLAKEQKKAEQKYIKFIDSLDPDIKTYTPFNIERNNIIMTYESGTFLPTKEIPMLKTREWVKLYRGFTNYPELKEFFEGDDQSPYVFKIPGIDKGQIYSNTLQISTNPPDTTRILDLIQKDFQLTEVKWHKEYINGEFTVHETNFDWNVMAMLLVQKDFYESTIFIVEAGEVLSRKNRFTLKYYKWGPENAFPIFFTLSNVKNDLVIKIAKIPIESDIQTMINVILSILDDYIENEEEIINIYKEYIPKFSTTQKAKKTAEKEHKTKLRLEALKKADPELFSGDYNKQCQGPSKQPRIPTAKEIITLKKDKPEELLEYPYKSGKYYTCEPFQKLKGTVNKYPGLVKNKNVANKNKYLPCCYPVSHYSRPNSILNKYLAEQVGGVEIETKATKHIDHVLGEEKRLPEFRRGKLPERLAYILKYIGLDAEEYNRFGVPFSPQSVIDAMALISNPSEWYKNPSAQRESTVKKLLKSNYLSAAAQSYSTKYLRAALSASKDTIAKDPLSLTKIGTAEFHPVLEYFFKSTVLVIQGDDLARPEAKFGFMAHLRQRKNMIILYMHQGYDQVEVIGTIKKEFTEYPLESITAALDLKRQCYGFYSFIHYKFPRTANISKRASAQYLDSFGKNRGYVVDGQSIFMPPSAPTGKPVIESLFYGDTASLIKATGEEPMYYKDGLVYTANFVLPTEDDDHKILSPPPDDYISPFIVSTSNFVDDSIKAERKARPNPYIKRLSLDSEDIITIYPQDEAGYLEIIRSLPAFQWENLVNLVWNPGQVHWVSIKDQQFVVKDVEYKPLLPDSSIGTWSVVIGDKIADDGQFIEYPGGHFGVIIG
uniref:Uncharacterized protein n=1 Tax=viral metagenome TaxID=1070528 RepID=A0A6C0JVI7_9ZZZZ